MLSYSISQNDETGTANVALYLDGEVLQARSDHPSYPAIFAGLTANDGAGDESVDYPALFNAERAIKDRFQRVSERVTVKNGEVYLDGDIVTGPLQDQIVAFLEAGEDFTALVNFYEKLLTNPLGKSTEDALVDWMKRQGESGGVSITPEGNVLGYKSLRTCEGGFKPSRASVTGQDSVNDVEVGVGNEIVQNAGDTVAMPRSLVLNAPSAACAEGLHVGTWGYAKGFSGDAKLLVEFNPRDVVSVPAYEGKIRVSRYTVVKQVTEALDTPLFSAAEIVADADSKGEFDGARAVDWDGDEGTLSGPNAKGDLVFTYDGDRYGYLVLATDEIGPAGAVADPAGDGYTVALDSGADNSPVARSDRRHGRGGRHSKSAEGNGLNPAQDPTSGQFVSGRPGSRRDNSTGRFSA